MREPLVVNRKALSNAIKAAFLAVRSPNISLGEFIPEGFLAGKTRCALGVGGAGLYLNAEESGRFVHAWAPADREPPVSEWCDLKLDLRLLRRALETLPGEQVSVTVDPPRVVLAAGGAIVTLRAEAFEPAEHPSTTVQFTLPDGLLAAATALLPYTSTDVTRPAPMNAQLAWGDGRWVAAATDMRRLGVVEFRRSSQPLKALQEVLLPATVLRHCRALLGEGPVALCAVSGRTDWRALRSESASLYWRDDGGMFPDWWRVIPTEDATGSVVLPVEATLRALRTALVVGIEDADLVTLREAAGVTTICSEHRDETWENDRAEAAVAEATWDGDRRATNLNGFYLGQLLRAHRTLGARAARFTFHGALGCILIEGVEAPRAPVARFRSAIMPMQK